MFSWKDFSKKAYKNKIVCYGAGVNAYLMLSKEIFSPFLDNILYFVDKNENKIGTFISYKNYEYEIKNISKLKKLDSNTIVIITIADYITTGQMLDDMKIIWFPWTVISTDLSFSFLNSISNDNQKKYFLLNTPDYMNLGDHAIAVAEKKYLNKVVGNIIEIGSNACHIDGLKRLSHYISDDDVIFVQGGGNMGSLWRTHEENIRNIVRIFSKNRIIIFPQSVYYGLSDEEKIYFEKSKEVYNSHNDLLICSRDKRSFEFVNSAYTCKSMLLPDMALTLNSKFSSRRNGIGLLLRDDKEKNFKGDYSIIVNKVAKILDVDVKIITHHPIDDLSNREKKIDELLEIYSSCELVITDRLHGMILSVVTNTPCIVFDNNYHKISDLYKTWLSEYNFITLSEQLNENKLIEIIKYKLSYTYPIYNTSGFIKEYDRLTDYLSNKK